MVEIIIVFSSTYCLTAPQMTYKLCAARRNSPPMVQWRKAFSDDTTNAVVLSPPRRAKNLAVWVVL